MEESVRPEPALHRPGPQLKSTGARATDPSHLADPRALTILTTEHWGLLTARSLVYNESFSRGGMYLTFLSGSLVALGFASQGLSGLTLPWVVLAILALDLFVGLATLGRLVSAGTEEVRALQAISRIRHAYLELVPTLEPYELGPASDDLASVVVGVYGAPASTKPPRALVMIAHGLTTMPGLICVLDAAVAGAIAAVIAGVVGASAPVALFVGVMSGLVAMFVLVRLLTVQFTRQGRTLPGRFPRPAADAGTEGSTP